MQEFVSSLLWLTEQEGAGGRQHLLCGIGCEERQVQLVVACGGGHMSYYACGAWRGPALLVDRASLRHKREQQAGRRPPRGVRADLAHLALHRVAARPPGRQLVGLAKHLCGVATGGAGLPARRRRNSNVMLGIVSWATCGDDAAGRRARRALGQRRASGRLGAEARRGGRRLGRGDGRGRAAGGGGDGAGGRLGRGAGRVK
uniref:Methyltransferase TRM13 domain-containing protein n=1 Tax=Heliothis virescens TaxID=7102 RepID=A0A2A4JNP7_HELVI